MALGPVAAGGLDGPLALQPEADALAELAAEQGWAELWLLCGHRSWSHEVEAAPVARPWRLRPWVAGISLLLVLLAWSHGRRCWP